MTFYDILCMAVVVIIPYAVGAVVVLVRVVNEITKKHTIITVRRSQ